MYMLSRYDAQNPAALQRLIDQGTQMHPFPNDVMQAASETAAELLQEEASEPGYAKLYDAYKQWRTEAYRWFGTAEQAYAAFAFGTDGSGECAF